MYPARTKQIHQQMKKLDWSQHFSHYKSMGYFFFNSSVPGQILPNFEPIRGLMVVFITCKNKKEPIKIDEARVVTRSSQL